MRVSLSIIISLLTLTCNATTVVDSVYINTGSLITTADTCAYWCVNQSPNFNQGDAVISTTPTDTLYLYVKNNDSRQHNLVFPSLNSSTGNLTSGSSITLQIPMTPGLHHYYDSLSDGYYMGISGVIHCTNSNHKQFYWHLRDLNTTDNNSIDVGSQSGIVNYRPDCFTINGKSFPDTKVDSTVKVIGNVNDTIHMHLINLGSMTHAIHYHGYHLRILSSSKFPQHVGRVKDSFPVLKNEHLSLELIPDKPGIYPVHDHNLVSVTVGGNYPGGMIGQLDISP